VVGAVLEAGPARLRPSRCRRVTEARAMVACELARGRSAGAAGRGETGCGRLTLGWAVATVAGGRLRLLCPRATAEWNARNPERAMTPRQAQALVWTWYREKHRPNSRATREVEGRDGRASREERFLPMIGIGGTYE